MAEGYEELLAEIDRIVNSPYPTQLKYLRDIVCTKCTNIDVFRWVLSKPCQVDRLARCILDGLQRWPYVLDILMRFASHVKIRDSLLYQEPTLLHDIVAQAVQAQDVHSRYVLATVNMLSSPLRTNVSLPAEVQTLSIQLFDHAAQEPSLATVKPIHQILRGTSTLLMSLLSSKTLLRFEEHLFNILRNMKGDNQSLSLYCLAIMKAMAQASQDDFRLSASSYDTQELLASTQLTSSKWTPEAIQQFFTDSKAQKTMQLVVLRTMWSCTASTGESLDERVDSLSVAQEVISAVPTHLRETWRKANALLVRKLEEKVLASSLEPEVRIQASCFLIRVTEGGVVPAMVTDSLRQIVVKQDVLLQALRHVEAVDLEFLVNSAVFDAETTTAFLQNVVDFVVSSDGQQILEHNCPLLKALQELNSAQSHLDAISEGIVLALDVLSCGTKLRNLANLSDRHSFGIEGRIHPATCHQAVHAARISLVHALSSCFLRASLSSAQSNYSVSQDVASLLLRMHASSAQDPPVCSHTAKLTSNPLRSVNFIEAESTPTESNLDWRANLQVELQNRARSDQDRLTSLFAKTCEDLEKRCQDVEAPLRNEKRTREQLQARHDDLNQAYTNLEAENIDGKIRANALEEEREQAVKDLDAVREQAEASLEKIYELERALSDSKTQAEKALAEARSANEVAFLEHATALAKKEEEVETLQASLTSRTEDVQAKVTELENAQEELRNVTSNLGEAKRELEASNGSLEQHRESISRLQTELQEAIEHRHELERQVDTTKHETESERDAHRMEIEQVRQQAIDDSVAMKSNHAQEVANTAQQHEEVVEGLKRQLSHTQDQGCQAQERHDAEVERLVSEASEKQKKIDRMSRKCEEKDRQIAGANAMRSNLMAAMGLTGQKNQFALPHRPSRSSVPQTQYPDMDSQDPSPPTPFSGDDADTQERPVGASFASNASSNESKSGPTPKRARPRKAFKMPSPAKPRLSATNMGTRSTRSSVAGRSTAKRQPLMTVNANQSSVKTAAQKTPSKGIAEGMDESTFDGSELFAGTQAGKMLNLDDILDGDIHNQI